MKTKIGFIGQGFIGKNYADDFESRGFPVVRYSLEPEYLENKVKIKNCDIVFIAVPTPSTPKGFDASILKQAIKLVGKGKIAVIKSTVAVGTTEDIQKENKATFVLHSPEFLTEATAAQDASHPSRNIIGLPIDNKVYRTKAESVMSLLPKAKVAFICKSKESELIKYGANNWFYFKVVYINLLYNLAQKAGCDYDVIREGLAADPRIGNSHLIPIHKSGTVGSDNYHLFKKKNQKAGGRGAGGHCFIKDYATLVGMYEKLLSKDKKGIAILKAVEAKNIDLLISSGKDLDLLAGVYGDQVLKN